MCTRHHGFWLIFTNLLTLGVYIADVVSDLVLATKYLNNGDTYWGTLTLIFALVPQFFMNMTMWYQEGRDPRTFILYFLQIGVVLRYLQIVSGVCCWCYDPWMIRLDSGLDESVQDRVSRTVNHVLSLVQLIGTLLESVPQICLQLYIILVTGELERMEIDTIKYATIGISVVAAVKTVCDWEIHYLFAKKLQYGLPFALWKVVELCSRIVALCVFSSLYRFWVFVVVGVHWLVMAITENVMCSYFGEPGKRWVSPENDIYSRSGKCMQFFFNLLTVSPVDVFAWTTFGSRSLSKVQPVVNGALTFAGNYIMVLMWYFWKDVSAWYDLYALIAVLAGTAASLLFLKPMYLLCFVRGPLTAISPV